MSESAYQALRAAVGGGAVSDEQLRPLLDWLERAIPSQLAERYQAWKREGLDGLFVARARALNEHSLEVLGQCILISDQTITPVRVEATARADRTISIMGNLGRPGREALGLERLPYGSMQAYRAMDRLIAGDDVIDWVYEF